MTRRKRKINKSIFIIPILTALVILAFLLLTTNTDFWFKKSVHEDAKKYETKHCLVFYPDSQTGKDFAKKLAKDNKQDKIYDYSIVPYGDYYLISYGGENKYFTDKQYNAIEIKEITENGKKIISDYLRYEVKKNKPELYYTMDFINSSYIDNLSFDGVTYDIYEESLKCNFPQYDIDVYVPLKYMQTEINMNFNYPNELYNKPTYIDMSGEHKIICLTFDDGPQFWYEPSESSSVSIIDTLYKYDACATFFVVGDMLEESDVWSDFEKHEFFKKSINQGNEYGSHTRSHDYLPDLTSSEIKDTIKYCGDYLYNLVGYNMTLYRPTGGSFDESVLAAQPYPAILWSDDSQDWLSLDTDTIVERMTNRNYYDGDILLFHEIYESSAVAIEKLVPYFIEQGYQLVTVSDMFKALGIDETELTFYYNFNPQPYYE